MFFMSREKSQMVQRDQALPGRNTPIATAATHFVTGRPLHGKRDAGLQEAMFGMGCFWGVERMFWGIEAIWDSEKMAVRMGEGEYIEKNYGHFGLTYKE